MTLKPRIKKPAKTEEVAPVSYLPMPSVTPPSVKPESATATPRGVVTPKAKPKEKEPYVPHKTAKEHAQDVMRDLPLGRVVQLKTGQPVGGELSTRDLSQYAKPSKTQQKIMDELVLKGVVQKRPNRAAIVSDKYRYELPESESDNQKVIDGIVAALTSKTFGWKNAEALPKAESVVGKVKGGTLDDRVSDGVRLALVK